jgi:hypothetical protein
MDSSLTQGFVDPAVLIDRRSYRGHDGGAILIGHRGAKPSSKKACPWSFLLVSSRMRMVLFIGLCRSRFFCLYTNFKRWCWGGRSCTSSVPVICWPVACTTISPHPPLVALSATSVGDLAMVAPSSPRPVAVPVESSMSVEPMSEALVPMMSGADGASQGPPASRWMASAPS